MGAVATRIELSSTPPQRHCFCLPYLQAPRPSHLLRRWYATLLLILVANPCSPEYFLIAAKLPTNSCLAVA
ncbi:hypothetical protein Prudu_016388 [Prunus dulcis]|uniref:Uncharacterized protein n=1 Tax=Prunus dulcis TaxID=3755 RepID=A0A4Y1RMG8_PRUDU|nr:hypothetical protein Prudu_016388 [Prunus dulcis]